MSFTRFELGAPLLRALTEEGYESPTAIQEKAMPPILEGRDVLGCAQTGTGKTAAFALPILKRLGEMPIDKSRRGQLPRALILSPTRELAAQIGESIATYGRHTALTHAVIFGGVSQVHQVRALQRGVDILVATPGRLIDLMQQRLVELSRIAVFVLDEADRMLDMGFIQPIRRIAAALPVQARPQTLLFSATMPGEIMHLAESLLRNAVKVAASPVSSAAPKIEQSLYHVSFKQKQQLLEVLLSRPGVERAVVFTRTKHGADRACRRLNQRGVAAVAIHGNKAQNYRTRALDAFKSGRTRVLVATDVAARGLDVEGITHVFNFDLPMEPEAYVHRIGRTGRAGAAGIAIAFCDPQERDLLKGIQKLTGSAIPVLETPELARQESVEREGSTASGHGGAEVVRREPRRDQRGAEWRKGKRGSGPGAAHTARGEDGSGRSVQRANGQAGQGGGVAGEGHAGGGPGAPARGLFSRNRRRARRF